MDTATAGHCQGESSVCTFGLNHPWLFLRPFSQWVWPDKYQLFGSTGNFLLCTTKNSCAVSFFFLKNEGKHPEFYGLEPHLVLEV